MAIYHLNASVGSRKSGQSAKAKFDYIMRTGKYLPGSREVLFSESGNMPKWATGNPRLFWEAADRQERENATLFRQYEFALPVELSEKERIALTRRFVSELTVGGEGEEGRMPYSLAIHRGGKNEHNPHVHLETSERLCNPDNAPGPETFFKDPRGGGCRKSRRYSSGDRKRELIRIRKRWATLTNEALLAAGRKERIDHRSFRDRGIDDIPDIHLGSNTDKMERKGIRTERGDRAVRRRRARRRLRELDIEKARIEAEINKEKENQNDRSSGPDRAGAGRERYREQSRPDHQVNGNGSEEKRKPSERDRRPDGKDRKNATFDPRTFGRRSGPVFDFSDLVDRHHSRKIVQESGVKKSDYWKEWREKILSEFYGQEIQRTSLSRWKIRKSKNSIEFQNWEDAGTKLVDTGGKIEAGSGNLVEIRGMIELAKVKGWKTVEWHGNDAFLLDAFRESLQAGVSVRLGDENQRRIWMEAKTDMERMERRQQPGAAIKP